MPRPTVRFEHRLLDPAPVTLVAAVPLTLGLLVGAITNVLVGVAVTGAAAAVIAAALAVWLGLLHPQSLEVDPDGGLLLRPARGDEVRTPASEGAVEPGRGRGLVLRRDGLGDVALSGHVVDVGGIATVLAERGWAMPWHPTVTRGDDAPRTVTWEPEELGRPAWFLVVRALALPLSGATVGLLVSGRVGASATLGLLVVTLLAAAELGWRWAMRDHTSQMLRIEPDGVEVVGDGGAAWLATGRLDELVIEGAIGAPIVEVHLVTTGARVATLRIPHDEAFALGDLLAVHGHPAHVRTAAANPFLTAWDAAVERFGT